MPSTAAGIQRMTAGAPQGPGVDTDPLTTTAPLAAEMASTLCNGTPGAPDDCSWYHGFWQYLRLFGLGATPYRHADFFDAAFAALAREGSHRRVLVSGAADYAMLAVVLRAYRGAGAEPETVAVDLCETPLFLSRWYAESVAATVKTQASDILDWTTDEPLDVVCTHSFLARFAPVRRTELMAKWRSILRPGGRVVTTARINPSWSPERARFTPDQVRAFRDRVFREASTWRERLGIDPEEMARSAQVYAERSATHSLTSADEVVTLFEGGGFELERLDLVARRGNIGAQRSGPGTHQDATYAEIVAVRR